MNSTKDLLSLKATRPDAYTALQTLASSIKYFSLNFNNERRIAILHAYSVLKITLLKQNCHKYNFLNRSYLDLHNRSEGSLSWKCLSLRQLRKFEAKKAAKVA